MYLTYCPSVALEGWRFFSLSFMVSEECCTVSHLQPFLTFAGCHWWGLDFRGHALNEAAWDFCEVTLICKKQSKKRMVWRADGGINNIDSYIIQKNYWETVLHIRVQSGKEAATINRDPFNRSNICPLYTKYQKIQGEWVIGDTDLPVTGTWQIQSPTSTYTCEKQIGN